jgi:hypothetical protein
LQVGWIPLEGYKILLLFLPDFNGLFDGLDLSSNKLGKTEKLKMS